MGWSQGLDLAENYELEPAVRARELELRAGGRMWSQ